LALISSNVLEQHPGHAAPRERVPWA